jgi:phosphate starvation-inducible PhoH-like protein
MRTTYMTGILTSLFITIHSFGHHSFGHHSISGYHSISKNLISTSRQILHNKFGTYVRNGHLPLKAKKLRAENYNAKFISPLYKPRTPNQELYVNYITNPSIPVIIGIGPAGSGKTLLACIHAVSALKQGLVKKIIITRPVVAVEEELGFLPGNLNHKMDPYVRPIFDVLQEFYSKKDIDSMLHGGILEISPLAYMRGRTFKNAFVIADEMQNSSPNQMLMLTTRIGEESKLIITGDLKQSDRDINNGLADLIQKIKHYNSYCNENGINQPDIRYVEMENMDIQRSKIVSKLLEVYSDKKDWTKKVDTTETKNTNSTECYKSSIIVQNDSAIIPLDQYSIITNKLLWIPNDI